MTRTLPLSLTLLISLCPRVSRADPPSWLDRAVTRSLYPGEDASLINRTKRFFDGPDDDQ